MRLSEQFLLGSTVVRGNPDALITDDHAAGCAFGIALIAGGAQFGFYPVHPDSTPRTGNAELAWPWTLEVGRTPCSCWLFSLNVRRKMKYRDIIVHLFDHHVFGKRDWSNDELAKWLRSVEPVEPDSSLSPVGGDELVDEKLLK